MRRLAEVQSCITKMPCRIHQRRGRSCFVSGVDRRRGFERLIRHRRVPDQVRAGLFRSIKGIKLIFFRITQRTNPFSGQVIKLSPRRNIVEFIPLRRVVGVATAGTDITHCFSMINTGSQLPGGYPLQQKKDSKSRFESCALWWAVLGLNQ